MSPHWIFFGFSSWNFPYACTYITTTHLNTSVRLKTSDWLSRRTSHGTLTINTILAKANRMLAFLRRNSVMSFTTDHRKLLYLTFVRSYIGYASEVRAPSTIGSITEIEDLQRRATKFILNTHWQEDISYHERLSRLNLLPLTYWHEVKDLIFLSR